MKVILLNGSPNEKGSTRRALDEVAGALNESGVETEIVWMGKQPVRGCIGCGGCSRTQNRCVFDDKANEVIAKMEQADGFIVGSPVYYAAASGSVTALLDRVFYAGGAVFAHKPGAAVVCARRAGTTAALDQLNKYFMISQMPVVSSQYWNMVHGAVPADLEHDQEGLQIMRTLGRNMAWLLKCIEAGPDVPEAEERAWTNFVR